MLEELEIRALGPIHHAVLRPARGMTAITGETGAGKSMLLNALRMISGGTAASRLVSPGEDEAWAQGIFAIGGGSSVADIVHDAGGSVEDDEIFLTRTLPAKGRSRAVLNGRSVPRAILGDISGELVTIHGQADQLRMASVGRQRDFLDRYAQDDALLDAYHTAWQRLNDIDAKLRGVTEQESDAMRKADYLRESIERIDRVAPHVGEDSELRTLRDRIENAAEITRGVGGALAALDSSQMDVDGGDAVGATSLIEQAVQSLRSIHVQGEYAEVAERLDALNTELSDVVFTLSGMLGGDDEAQDLDGINDRIHELGELTRRWGPTLEDVLAWREQAGYDLEDLDASPERVDQLRKERESAYEAALSAADALHEARAAAAGELSSRVGDELASLAMSGASLDIDVQVRRRPDSAAAGDFGPLDASGGDDIRFLFTPFPGSPKLPMGKSASGGELSRLMLALELVAAERGMNGGDDFAMTFVFDEVDAGVGGKTAVELGRRLAKLAEHAQVIVVTHLAQVASWANAQFVVSKTVEAAGGDDGANTTVTEVRDDAREREIARMLAGSESKTSLVHARELLESSAL
ncbi:DNA repair protein RecN [Bifidobacterium sp. SMB2]|uniref:DNA repair protein RecN n=1 Tax=Bifidobacterium saimiriisciurei TaxID=2661627 RepID=A0ABX0CEU8_9BIFI|nr:MULTISPECIES: DNA repair protein RecN [Bifidobacterium]NEG96030.1 DNA repair protein RecN [Bifidobacterium sp. SMB2]NEH10892.1 DNA repair protein RecN [Bifidobacterium saimiriisciurei]